MPPPRAGPPQPPRSARPRTRDDDEAIGATGRDRRRLGGQAVTEAVVGQLLESRDHLARSRPGGRDQQRVPEPGPERHHVGETGGANRLAAPGLGYPHLSVEPAHGLDEARRRPGVEADRVANQDRGLGIRRGRRRGFDGRGAVVRDPKLGALHRQRAPGLGRHFLERGAAARRGGGGHRPLDQRRLAHHDLAGRVAQQFDRKLGAHQRTAQVHQHEDPIGRHGPLDRGLHAFGARAEDASLLSSAGGLERQFRAAHLARQGDDALGQRGAVGDHHDPDHVQRPLRVGTPGAGNRSDGPISRRWRG